jgi:predicted CoA-binding protein
MARTLGMPLEKLPLEEQFYLQGLESDASWQGKRWIRLAAEEPEKINYVDFYRNGAFVYRSYDEPYFMYRETTWIQKPWIIRKDDRTWVAEVVLHDGTTVVKSADVRD